MKTLPRFILLVLLAMSAHAQPLALGFVRSPSETNGMVQSYVAYWCPTNQPLVLSNATTFGFCYAGQTNLTIPDSVPNRVNLAIITWGTNGFASDFSPPTLYDTNQFYVPPVPANPVPGKATKLKVYRPKLTP